jgi:serine/threonine-protein kinase
MAADRTLDDLATDPGTTGEVAPQPCIAGRFEVRGLVGAGGMGTVYRVFDRELDETVALKLLRGVARADALTRLRSEVRLARRVTHPNVVRTFDLGEHEEDGQVVRFLTMEYVDGPSLARVLAEKGPLPAADVVGVGRQIAEGVAAAHRAGVLHRDLKPDNVLLAEGRALITDFGIARPAGDEGGPVVGTPSYMAPEQLRGDAAGPAADVFAIGAILFEMYTGARAFSGVDRPAVPPSAMPGFPALGAVVARCLEAEPAARFGTAAEVAAALAGLVPAAEPTSRVTAPATHRAGAPIVALAPIRNLAGDDAGYLATGLGEELNDALAALGGVRIAPIRNPALDPVEAATRLGAQALVEGAIRRIPSGELRLSARLASTAEGFQLWSRRCDGDAAQLLASVARWVQEMGDALAVHSRARGAGRSTDPEAVDAFLRARERLRFDDMEGAVHWLEVALARSPDDPSILATYATVLARSTYYVVSNVQDAADRIRRATAAAARAVAIAPELGDGWVATASARNLAGDLPGTARALKTAVSRSPSLVRAQEMVGWLLCECDRLDEAIARFRDTLALDPSSLAYGELTRAYGLLGRWADVDRVFAALDVHFADANVLGRQHTLLRFASWDLARPAPAIVPAQVGPEWRLFLEMTVCALRRSPLPPQFRDEIRATALSASPRLKTLLGQFAAETASACGDADFALEMVDVALRGPFVDLAWANRCPILGALRAHPGWPARYAEISRRAAGVLAALDGPPETGVTPAPLA